MPSIELDHVDKQYPNGVIALHDIRASIVNRCLYVLVGPSGCGKTTLLRMIAGLESPTKGRILFDGHDVAGIEPKDRRIGMVFQSAPLYPHLNVMENLGFAMPRGDAHSKPPAEVIRETAEWLGIGDLLCRRPDELSGGQTRRVALGKAILRNSEILLLDEPLSHLDGPQRETIGQMIVDIHRKRNLTTVYVTHDRMEAMSIADSICVLNQGHIQQIGPPGEIVEQPANRFVADFFREPMRPDPRGQSLSDRKPDEDASVTSDRGKPHSWNPTGKDIV